jgi:hypothetical protein
MELSLSSCSPDSVLQSARWRAAQTSHLPGGEWARSFGWLAIVRNLSLEVIFIVLLPERSGCVSKCPMQR